MVSWDLRCNVFIHFRIVGACGLWIMYMGNELFACCAILRLKFYSTIKWWIIRKNSQKCALQLVESVTILFGNHFVSFPNSFCAPKQAKEIHWKECDRKWLIDKEKKSVSTDKKKPSYDICVIATAITVCLSPIAVHHLRWISSDVRRAHTTCIVHLYVCRIGTSTNENNFT